MGRKRQIPEEKFNEIVRMYREGVPVKEISSGLHVGYATVYNSITASRRRKTEKRLSNFRDVKTLSDNIDHEEAAPRRLLIDPKSRANIFC